MKDGLYLFCGTEDFLKEEAERSLVSSHLASDARVLNRDVYDAKDGLKDIFNSLDTLTFISNKRVVIVKNVESLAQFQRGAFLAYLKRLPKHVLLILQSSQTVQNDKFIREISRYAKTTEFKKLRIWELKDWVYKRLKNDKKTITKEGLDLLLELKGNEDLTALSRELEKLIIYSGENKIITKEDVSELVQKGPTTRALDLINAISLRDRDSALIIAGEILSGGKKEISEIMGLMGWHFRRLWKAKTLLANGEDKERIASALKIRDFLIDRFISQANIFSTEGLKRIFGLLLEADHGLKRGGHKPEFILERLIVELCG